MIYYIIRHKENKVLLPARVQATGFNFYRHSLPPRLFAKACHANSCIRAWARGYWTRREETDGDWETGYYSYLGLPAPDGGPKRSADELEVVTVELLEK